MFKKGLNQFGLLPTYWRQYLKSTFIDLSNGPLKKVCLAKILDSCKKKIFWIQNFLFGGIFFLFLWINF